jgi:hypothetical protein
MRPTVSPFFADSAARDRPAGPQPMITKSSTEVSVVIGNSCKQRFKTKNQLVEECHNRKISLCHAIFLNPS